MAAMSVGLLKQRVQNRISGVSDGIGPFRSGKAPSYPYRGNRERTTRFRTHPCRSLAIAGPIVKPEKVASKPSRCGEQHIMPTSTVFEIGK